jgi:hypothetical protein
VERKIIGAEVATATLSFKCACLGGQRKVEI